MLNISRQIQTGWNTQQKHPLPEAEIIPIGESINEKKKLERISSRFATLIEHENIPLPGFTLFESNRKNWGSLDTTWLVIDPRGFLVRISNDNLENILHVTGITEGLIQERCVWARNDTQTKMTLVPVSSPIYIEAVKNTQLIEEKVNMKDVQIGDKVILQNEIEGTYMGVLSIYGPLSNYTIGHIYQPQTFLRRQIVEFEPGKYYYQTDLKILKVLWKTENPMTREDSAKLINFSLGNSGYFTNTPHQKFAAYTVRGSAAYVSTDSIKDVPLTYEEININEAEHLFMSAQQTCDIGQLMLESVGSFYLIDFPFLPSMGTPQTSFHISEIKFHLNNKIELEQSRRYARAGDKTFTLDKFTKFYKIVKNVKTATYI